MGSWKLICGFTLVILLIGVYLYLAIAKPGNNGDLGLQDQVVVATGVFSGFALWIWMFTDFFRRKDIRHRVLWGWALFLANLLAAAVYFVFIYFPQERNRRSA
jgi:hypothetical protein